MALEGRHKFGYLTGEIPKPSIGDPQEQMWKGEDSLLRSILIGSMEPQVHEYKQGTMDVTSYFNKLSLLWQEIDLCREMIWNCSCGGVLHYQSEETDRVYDFLSGLNSKFDTVRSCILGTRPIPSLMEVCSEVRLEEDRSKAMNSTLVTPTNSTVFKTSGPVQDKQNTKPPLVCEHCKKPGTLKISAGNFTVDRQMDLNSGMTIGTARHDRGLYFLTEEDM
ncbi:uncharacterized protein LOC120072153 [Benincasa hispida]|uniref:uncharacterized protein LOC120072153 n=1 Tax=Benincasa hispida TaxID=102211 RepID=UPI001900B9B9|nr:uncharacterized protein LOC120072153 [Benincasa hispida]